MPKTPFIPTIRGNGSDELPRTLADMEPDGIFFVNRTNWMLWFKKRFSKQKSKTSSVNRNLL